ncbi:SDR family oxidoreductase [Gluconacetobacter takamatsuzukensis]|uniref:SDR family oxidoreductase n=1 Tax=Gluconacetobacter takamatsuzukensis TaxID=1286190 RepID=A0A7W4KFL7_9PROT|nr:SDR family oxidoreductase [Gluconacetobacter takamatsuzukensis]MBB2206026.1 SDR family oxidoreductase [Gluconacetobacter takamatsuzukensis]
MIFGGSRGIGAGIARQLAQDGYAVGLTYVSRPEQANAVAAAIVADGGSAMAIPADSADPSALHAAVDQVVSHYGLLDVAVVNAGVLRLGPLETFAPDDLDLSLTVNVRGVVLAVQAAIARMRDGGRVITIGSIAAIRPIAPGSSIYAMTKAAVAAFVKGAALDLAPRRITINNIQPGPIETDMTEGMTRHLVAAMPLGRMGQPQDIAALASYLASPAASFMTGASLTIDGGFVL